MELVDVTIYAEKYFGLRERSLQQAAEDVAERPDATLGEFVDRLRKEAMQQEGKVKRGSELE